MKEVNRRQQHGASNLFKFIEISRRQRYSLDCLTCDIKGKIERATAIEKEFSQSFGKKRWV